MKTKIFWVVGLIFLCGELFSQSASPRLSKDEVIARKWEFILEKTKLSPADAVKVEPIFKESELEVWNLIEKNRLIFRHHRRSDSEPKVNMEQINDAIINFEIEKGIIQKHYYLKLKKVIPAETINKLLNAERIYKRDLMQGAPGRSKDKNEVR